MYEIKYWVKFKEAEKNRKEHSKDYFRQWHMNCEQCERQYHQRAAASGGVGQGTKESQEISSDHCPGQPELDSFGHCELAQSKCLRTLS